MAAGLAAARFGLRSLLAVAEINSGGPLPFWMNDTLTPTTVIYAGALTILSTVIIGVLPALNVTGRAQQARLRQSAGAGGGLRFAGVWSAVIASQVAVTLMFPAAAFFFHRFVVNSQTRDPGIPAGEYLSALIALDREVAPSIPPDTTEQAFRSRLGTTYLELERRVSSEPAVTGLTFADQLPGMRHARWRIEIEGDAAVSTSAPGHEVASAAVAVNFFDVLGAPVFPGRNFATADLASSAEVVIVNQSFVQHVAGGQNPVGRRVRHRPQRTQPPGPWLEIIGFVHDLGMLGPESGAGLYRPVSAESASPLRVAVHVKERPDSFASRLRSVASDVEPALQLHQLMPLDQVGASGWVESQYLSRALAVLSAIALLLSLTAIYAVMAFAVSTRTREIGLRAALGADRRRVLAVILHRPVAQVAIGIVAGATLVAVTFVGLFETMPSAMETALIAAYAMLMMGICMLACVVPARRALRVEPARALAAEG